MMAGEVAEQVSALSPSDALVVLLTVETLLFAAFAVGAALGATTEFGRPLPTSMAAFGVAVSIVVTLVAAGALAAWSDAYIHHGIHNPYQAVEAAAILVGIVAEVVFAWWTTVALRGS
jgi:hypothetical protein